jgi:hypothetical protein
MEGNLALAATLITAILASPLYGENERSTSPSTRPDCAPDGDDAGFG